MNKTRKVLSTSSLRKVTAPFLPFMIVHREALVQRLNEAIIGGTSISPIGTPRYRLILLEAPAGYGKTTLLAEFAQQSPIICCWYFLDHNDTEPLVFLRTLLASLQRGFSSFGTHLVTLLNEAVGAVDSSFPSRFLEALVETLTNEVSQRFVLLLCNYQEVNAHAEITLLVEYLLSHLPEQVVVVLESREIPELDFVSLLAERAIIGLGRESLRFTSQEICLLAQVQKRRELSITTAEHLANAFDGWITGLLLSTQLGDVQFLRRNWSVPLSREQQGVHIHTQALSSYVVKEVFKRHQQLYSFLKEAVVIQKMTPFLCSELLGITQSEAGRCLQELEQRGLFVTHSGEGEQLVYTCHSVLRALLYEELRQQNPERFTQLHRRAAELLSATQYYEQAIYHALEANIDDLAVQLIIASAGQMTDRGYLETLQQWIAAFSEATLVRYPRLLLIQAEVFLQKGELHEALPLLEKLTGLLNNSTQGLPAPEERSLLQGELAIVRARALSQQGQYFQAQDLCQHVLTYLPPDEVALHARAHLCFGQCAQSLGDLTTKITHYQKSLQLLGRHTVNYLTANGHSSLASTYSMLGHFALAEHHSTRATACWEQLQNIQGIVNHLIIQANIKWDQDRFDEAERFLQQALTLAGSNPARLRRWQGYTLVNLGDFYQDQGLSERSLAPAEEGLALARQLGDSYLLNYALMTLTRTYLSMGDAVTANLLLSEVHLGETATIPACSYQQARRDLLQGAILLDQHHYTGAHRLLASAEAALKTMGIKRERLKALVRLAACYLREKQLIKAFEQLASLERILTAVDGYRRLVCTEVRMFPYLQHAIEQRPEGIFLRTLFHWQSSKQEQIFRETKGELPLLEASPPSIVLAQPRGSPRLKFLALGEPTVLLDGRPVTHWRMARAMELCFYLLEYGQSVRKEQILTALWGTVDDHASQTFYSTIHYLRKALGGELAIVSKGGIYSLDLSLSHSEGKVWYDVAAFEEQYALGKQALAEGKEETAKVAFEAAVKLYRGDYVQPFYSDWCISRREELQRLYLDLRRQLAQLAWYHEKVEESILHWQHMLTVDACLEEAHYGLMRCYVRQGKRRLALQQYQRCTKILQREWGAIPGTVVQNLYRRLMGSSKTEEGLF